MPDLRQVLKEFVATANAGGYKTENELLSKFPELSGYDGSVLKEFVATANAGGYKTENELLSKFPEFSGAPVDTEPVKKKDEAYTTPLWQQPQGQPEPEPRQEQTLPFLESKPSGFSLESQRVPEEEVVQRPVAPYRQSLIDESLPELKTPEEIQAIIEAPEVESKVAESEQGWLLNTVSSLDRGFAKNLIGNPVKGIGTLLEGATSKVFGGTGKGPISDALISFGNYYNNAIDELTPQDEDFKNTLTDQFGQAFGQVASLIMTGGIAGATKQSVAVAATAPTGIIGTVGAAGKQLASTLVSPVAISGGLSMGQAEFDRAKEAGATDEQAYEIFFKNAAVGSVLEQIPVMQFLKRFNQSTAGGVTNYIKTKGVAGLTGGFEEMTTEVLQQLYSNKTAQEVYNINQQLLEGVGESGGVGFGVGFLLNAMGARVKKLKKEGNTAEAQLIEAQIDNFESKPKGPPPTYSINGIKIEDPEVINQMIDNMDATDLSNSKIEITNDPELNMKMQDKMVISSIKEEVRSANPDIDEDTLDQITALEKERKKFEGKKTQSAKDKLASINLQIKTLQENAVQKSSTEESVLRAEESQVGLPEVGEGNAQVQAPTEEVVQEEVVDEDLQALFDRLPDETEAVAEQPILSEESQKVKTQLEDFKNTFDEAYNAVYPRYDTPQAKRSAIAKSKRAIKKLQQMMGFDIGAYWELDSNQTKKREALYSLGENKDYDSYDQMVAAYQKDVAEGNQSELFTSINTLLGIAPKETEAVAPATPVVDAKPKVSSKIPKAKSVPIPVAIPKPAAPAPKPVAVVSQPQEDVKIYSYNGRNYEIKKLSVKEVGTGRLLPLKFGETVEAEGKLLTPAIPVVAKAKAAPKAKVEPVKVVPTIVSKPVIESKPVIVPAPTTIVGPVQLKEAHMASVNAVRIDQTLTQRQKDAKVDALKVEYQARKAEMESAAPAVAKPKTEAKSSVKAAPKKVEEEDGPSLEDLEEVDDIVDEDEDGDDFESIQDLDPKVESIGKRVIDRINKLDAALVKHSKSSLNSGIPIPVARLILKAIKESIKLGMTINQAITKIAADRNLAKKDIIESLKELDAIYLSQSALAKVRAQVNLEVTAALASKRSVNEKRKALSDAIKAMAVTGDIASTKVQTLLNRIGKVNLDNPVAVENFLKYVENVFNDAAYDTELAGLRAKVARAKTNVGTKLGTAEGITPLINRLLSIKPSLIPAELLNSYREIIEMFGSSDAVLALGNIDEVTTQIQELLDGIDEYLSVIPELTELLSDYDNRVLNKDGSLNYQETLVKMLADKTITEEQYNIMRKYKSLIVSKEAKPTKTKEEDAKEKKVLLEALSQTDVDMSAVIGNDEKKMAARLIKLAKSSAANILTNRQLLNLLKVFDNINNGYFPHYANKLYVELEAAHKVGFLTKALLKAKMPKLAKLKVKYFGSDSREAIFDRIKNLPLFNIDEVFGDFKTKEFFNAIFDQLASAQQVYNIEVERIGKRLDAMSDRIAKSYGDNHNGFVEAKMKMAIYRIQREYESNPGDERVNPALAYINKTLEAIKENNTMYSNRDAKLLKEIATEYSKGTGENATIDNDKLFASFTLTEKAALKLFDDINKSLQSLAVFTGDVIRGDQVHLLVDYNHLNVLPGKKQASSSLAEASEKFNPSSVVSTKAGSLTKRTKGVKAINFDIFSTVERGANHVLLDYHLTNPVRIARRAISLTRQQIEDSNDGSEATSNQLDMLGAIDDAVELALEAMLDSALVKDSVADMIAKDLARTGYRAMLAGIPRASVELASNMSYVAIAAPKEYAKGISISRKNKSVVWGEKAANIMKVAGAKTMSRVIGSDSLTGRIVDSSVLSKRTKRSSTILTPIENTILSYHNKSTKKFKNGVEYIADNLISSPDKIMMRPLWFGSFANAFKSITGVEVDFDKMNDADVDYLTEYQDAINSATNVADEKVAMAGNVDNPFMNSLRSFIPSEASALEKTYKVFNNFMNKFMIGEYLVFRRGAHALMRDGSISRKQGVALMAAVVTRMTVYSVMLSLVSQFVYGLFTDDEDEDDQKSFDKKLGQGLASTATSLLLGRTYGNLVRTGINAGVELFNEEYLDGLREGDYDPYKDAIQYTFIQPGTTGKGVDLGDVFTAVAGPFAPAMKTASFALKTLGAADKKEDAAIERADDEKYYRLPLEIFGNLGYVPLYKDIRTIVNKNIYAALDKELKKQEKKKASGGGDKEKESDFKPMGLNRVDLKRYYPEIYEQYYGEGSEAEATRKIEYEKNRLEREIKDERYGYIPKKRSRTRGTTRSKARDTKRRGGR